MSTQPRLEPGQDTFNEAIDVLRTAAALGMNVPTIPGTTVYAAWIHWDKYAQPNPMLVGVYDTYEAALIAIRNIVVDQWAYALDDPPWTHDDIPHDTAQDYYTHRDTELIIVDYMRITRLMESHTIVPLTVETTPRLSDGSL